MQIKIVYIKASEGTKYINPYFESSYQKAKENTRENKIFPSALANRPVPNGTPELWCERSEL